jgi:hypothetical protein
MARLNRMAQLWESNIFRVNDLRIRLLPMTLLGIGLFVDPCRGDDDVLKVLGSGALLAVVQSTGEREVPDEPASRGMLAATYEVHLQIQTIVAGAPEHSRYGDTLTVRLVAADRAYFEAGREFVVLLDPRLIADGKPLNWARLELFACFKKTELDRNGLSIGGYRATIVGDDVCKQYDVRS